MNREGRKGTTYLTTEGTEDTEDWSFALGTSPKRSHCEWDDIGRFLRTEAVPKKT